MSEYSVKVIIATHKKFDSYGAPKHIYKNSASRSCR